MTNNFILTKEADLKSNDYINNIDLFWQSGTFDSFEGCDSHRIEYAYFYNENHNSTIVISPGRCEGYLKYKEVVFDLFENKYNVFIVDHRGQGLSQRTLKNTHKGYVEKFDIYAIDLHTFIQRVVIPKANELPYLLGHSMGCAIAARMFQICDKVVKSAVLLSPMIAINSGPLPYPLAKLIVSSGHKLNKFLAPNNPWYFLGQNNYQATPFERNVLTHSTCRYNRFIELYIENTQLQLGGVTFQWLSEAIKNETNLFKDIQSTNTPIVVIQAGNDTVVNNQQQYNFCEKLKAISSATVKTNLFVIEGARHELLFETDNIRIETFKYILTHFSQELRM